jgi:hypothetical protein
MKHNMKTEDQWKCVISDVHACAVCCGHFVAQKICAAYNLTFGEGSIYGYDIKNMFVQMYYTCINTKTYKSILVSFRYIIVIIIMEI